MFWIIGARNFEIRSFLISKYFGLWKPKPPKTELFKIHKCFEVEIYYCITLQIQIIASA